MTMDMEKEYNMNFRCFFGSEIPSNNYSNYYQALAVKDIPRWIESYQFTHPSCTSISCKVWFEWQDRTREQDEKEGESDYDPA